MPRNVVLITVDSLRAGNLSFMGYDRRTAPAMEAFAKDSTVYKNAFSHGSDTGSSFISILTGQYPLSADIWREEEPHNPPLPGYFTTIAESFKEKGYATGGFHCNPFISTLYGYERGYDSFFDALGKEDASKRRRVARKLMNMLFGIRHSHPRLYWQLMRVRDRFFGMRSSPVMAPDLNSRALDFAEKADEPFFLFIHYTDVHAPYMPSRETLKELTGRDMSKQRMVRLNRAVFEWRGDLIKDVSEVVDLYDAGLYDFDKDLGSLLDGLDSMGFLDNSVIALSSDHGEGFLEHGQVKHDPAIFYDEMIHVPLMIKGGGSGEEGGIVSQVEIAPTLMKLAGLQPNPAFATGPIEEGGSSLHFSEARTQEGPVVSARSQGWKFIWNMGKRVREFYDLENDPDEMTDVSGEREKGVTAFSEAVENHVTEVESQTISLKARALRH